MVATPSAIPPETERRINRHVNLIRHTYERRYASAYVAWLRGGAVGFEPEHPRVSKAAAARVRADVQAFRPWG